MGKNWAERMGCVVMGPELCREPSLGSTRAVGGVGAALPTADPSFASSGAESPRVAADVGAVCDHLVLSW